MALEKKIAHLINDGASHTWIWCEDWQLDILGIRAAVAEGYSLALGTFHTLKRGTHVVSVYCYTPPQPAPTHAQILGALEAKMTETIAAYPAKLAADVAHLKKVAAARGITVPPPTTSPASEGPAGDKEND